MVAQIFTDIIETEIRVVWHEKTAGYVSGLWFEIDNEQVIFPNSDIDQTDRDLYRALQIAIRRTPEFKEAKRESKSFHLIVTDGYFPGVYSVRNPLNGNIYNAVIHPDKTFCECADHQTRRSECKHLKAVKRHIQKALEPKLKLRNWTGKQSAGKLRAITEDEWYAQYTQAKADLGFS